MTIDMPTPGRDSERDHKAPWNFFLKNISQGSIFKILLSLNPSVFTSEDFEKIDFPESSSERFEGGAQGLALLMFNFLFPCFKKHVLSPFAANLPLKAFKPVIPIFNSWLSAVAAKNWAGLDLRQPSVGFLGLFWTPATAVWTLFKMNVNTYVFASGFALKAALISLFYLTAGYASEHVKSNFFFHKSVL